MKSYFKLITIKCREHLGRKHPYSQIIYGKNHATQLQLAKKSVRGLNHHFIACDVPQLVRGIQISTFPNKAFGECGVVSTYSKKQLDSLVYFGY
jgi:hypothetical protein